jgi:hypothetical protein
MELEFFTVWSRTKIESSAILPPRMPVRIPVPVRKTKNTSGVICEQMAKVPVPHVVAELMNQKKKIR